MSARGRRTRKPDHVMDIRNLLPATFTAPGISEREFLAICRKFPNARLEYEADGTVLVLPLNDFETSARSVGMACELTVKGTRFPQFAPNFVIELRSPTDRLTPLARKMQEYVDNGVQLAWLIDPQNRTVSIYRPGAEPTILVDPAEVRGEGPVEGFVLPLTEIF